LPSRFARSLREPDALRSLSTERRERVLPLVDLTTEIEATGDGLVADVQVADRQALPVNLGLVARSGPVPTLVQDEQWAGDPKVIPYPHGAAESGKVSVEIVGYGRHDWGYTSQTLEVDPETVRGNPQSEIRRRIESLPQEAVVLRRRLFIGRERRFRDQVAAAINSTSNELAELAYVIVGHGNKHERAWRIVETLRSLIAIDSRNPEFSTPAAVLKAGRGSPSAWAISFATIARHAGFETGIAREKSGGKQLVALIKGSNNWLLIPATAGYQLASLTPVLPWESLGSVEALTEPPNPPRPQPVGPAWAFLHEFREPSPPDETDLAQDEPTPDLPTPNEADRTPPPKPQKQTGSWPLPSGLNQHSAESRAKLETSRPELLAKHPRAYLPWNADEDEFLTQLHQAGCSTAKMSELLDRNSGAINSRLDRLGLEQK
jgi:hypothetical protein